MSSWNPSGSADAPALLRWDVPGAEALRELLGAPLPYGLRAGAARRYLYRDVYYDTPAGDLARRGAVCRVRFHLDGRRRLAVRVEGREVEAMAGGDVVAALGGDSPPARRLRALVEPARLVQRIELETERHVRRAATLLVPLPRCDFLYDDVTVRGPDEGAARFQELGLRPAPWAFLDPARLARAVEHQYGLRRAPAGPLARALDLLSTAESDELARAVQRPPEIAVVAVEHGRLGLLRVGTGLRLPFGEGSGEPACRETMRRFFGSAEGEVRLLGTVPPAGARPPIEVWMARRLRRGLGGNGGGGGGAGALQWFTPADLVARAGSPVLRDPRTLAALAVAARSELLPEWSHGAPGDSGEMAAASRVTLSELRVPSLDSDQLDVGRGDPEQFINAELSWLEFNARVLALAEDPATPLLARLRFLSIFSTNLDQFFAVQVAALKHAVATGFTHRSPDGLTPRDQLDAIAIRLRPVVARQYRCFHELRDGPLAARGVRVVAWETLSAEERGQLAAYFAEHVLPLLTPKALTRAPGHPFPYIRDRRISLALVLRDAPASPVHYVHLELPDGVPRFVPLSPPGSQPQPLRFAMLEEVVRANLGALLPGREILQAHAFRITRSGEMQLDEPGAANFVQAIEEELRRRALGPVVRLEVEEAMPPAMRDLLQREFRFEESERLSALAPSDVYEAQGMVDLGSLAELAALPPPVPEDDYPALRPAEPLPADRPVLDVLDERAVLVHHPYDSFEASFERFVIEAADDPDVVGLKLTLYRPGGPSRIGDALRRAAAAGKDVSVIVELKARFDEELNIGWAKSLEQAGIHVVTGLVNLKTHAKMALVTRKRGGRVRRYAHVATGNYNPETARVFTDLGLFTADEGIGAELAALFNELTGSARPPRARFQRLLVAPATLLPRLLELIEREAAHARAGRGGLVRAKINGLADAQLIGALYRASQAGVDVNLIVRGICMLRPGVPGLSERIRVTSVLGRFLEHARVYQFGNAGDPVYYIASADWRPRNLRRRIEVAAPVDDPAARARLNRILETELNDPTAWDLTADGSYVRRAPGRDRPARGAQEVLLEGG